jgi:peptidoglycan/LPS O-acetylase OafA/YrhL
MTALRQAGEGDETQPAVAPPPGHPRFPHVDALRAIAALSIVVLHCSYPTGELNGRIQGPFLNRLNVGVTLFFLISGFLLYRPFAAHRLIGARDTRLRDYLRRRLLRIVPAYWLALTLLAIWPGLPDVFTSHWWIYYGFGQIYNDGYVLKGIGPAWSLCVEMTFYLFLPVYAAVLSWTIGRLNLRAQIRLELVLLVAMAAASAWYRGWVVHHDFISPVLNTLPTFMDWFAIGMGFAVVSVALQARDPALPDPAALRLMRRAPWLPWLGAAVAFWIVSKRVSGPHFVNVFGHAALVFTPGETVSITILFGIAAAGVLAPAVFGADGGGWVRRLLSHPALQWLGLISYGVYLWHSPIMDEVCGFSAAPGHVGCTFHGVTPLTHVAFPALVLIVAGLAIVAATASYYLVERPVLAFKNGLPRRPHARRTPVTDG